MEFYKVTFCTFLSKYLHRLSAIDMARAAYLGGERKVYLMAHKGWGIFDRSTFVKPEYVLTKLLQKEGELREIMKKYGFEQVDLPPYKEEEK